MWFLGLQIHFTYVEQGKETPSVHWAQASGRGSSRHGSWPLEVSEQTSVHPGSAQTWYQQDVPLKSLSLLGWPCVYWCYSNMCEGLLIGTLVIQVPKAHPSTDENSWTWSSSLNMQLHQGVSLIASCLYGLGEEPPGCCGFLSCLTGVVWVLCLMSLSLPSKMFSSKKAVSQQYTWAQRPISLAIPDHASWQLALNFISSDNVCFCSV